MPFTDHLDALRKMMMRILLMLIAASIISFCFKDYIFKVILAPLDTEFITFTWLKNILASIGSKFEIGEQTPAIIATDISSQFMVHISMSFYAGILISSPYIVHSLLGYILPALYDNERKYASRLCIIVYTLFISGLMLSYFVMLPVSSRFLSSYSVSERVVTMIDINSYISLFVSLSLVLGVVFQLPVIACFLARIGLINGEILRHYRRHAIVATSIVAGIITPPDALSLILVALPIYALYEISIPIVSRVENKNKIKQPSIAILSSHNENG